MRERRTTRAGLAALTADHVRQRIAQACREGRVLDQQQVDELQQLLRYRRHLLRAGDGK